MFSSRPYLTLFGRKKISIVIFELRPYLEECGEEIYQTDRTAGKKDPEVKQAYLCVKENLQPYPEGF